jgi:hypothetical protein
VKTASPANDVTLAATGGIDRERLLWESGALDRLGAGLAHPILEVTRHGDETVTVMRDVGASIPGWTRTLSSAECEPIMRALATLHATFLGDVPDAACPLATRIGLLAPGAIARVTGPDNSLAGAIATGWERFFDLVGGDVGAAVAAIHADATVLAFPLARSEMTLTHADLWLVNLALEPDKVVLLDWAIATEAPGVLDLAVFLTGTAAHVEPTREELIDMYRAADPSVGDDTLALALLFGLCDMGWNKALDAADHADPTMRERERIDLEWWVAHAADALEFL